MTGLSTTASMRVSSNISTRNSGAAAIRDDFTTQVDEVEHEAGVRLTT